MANVFRQVWTDSCRWTMKLLSLMTLKYFVTFFTVNKNVEYFQCRESISRLSSGDKIYLVYKNTKARGGLCLGSSRVWNDLAPAQPVSGCHPGPGHLIPSSENSWQFKSLKSILNYKRLCPSVCVCACLCVCLCVPLAWFKRRYEVKTNYGPPFKMFLSTFREASEKKNQKN